MGTRDTGAPRQAYDGLARCALCSAEVPEGQVWCPASNSLACDACCRALVTGDPERVLTVLMGTEADLDIKQLLDACAECPRLPRRLAEDSPSDEHPREQTLN